MSCGSGVVSNSILFCWLFTIKDQCQKVRSQQMYNQGLRQPVFHGVLGPLRLVWHARQCRCFSRVPSNAWGESRALEGRCVSSKSPSRVWDRDEGGSCWEERKRIVFPWRGTKKGNRTKNWVNGQTYCGCLAYNIIFTWKRGIVLTRIELEETITAPPWL